MKPWGWVVTGGMVLVTWSAVVSGVAAAIGLAAFLGLLAFGIWFYYWLYKVMTASWRLRRLERRAGPGQTAAIYGRMDPGLREQVQVAMPRSRWGRPRGI